MTYISAQLTENKQQVIVWERVDGKLITKRYKAPYYFYFQDPDGKYLDIYGNKLDKLEFNNYKDFYRTREELKRDGVQLYESDISPEYKVLTENYFRKPSGKLNVTFLDIEVTKNPAIGWATIENPYAEICSISFYHQWKKEMIVYAVPPDDSWTLDRIPGEVHKLAKIVLCKNEKELLAGILVEISDSDVLSHWNGAGFDVPYIYQRLLNVLGEPYANMLSFPGAKPPKLREYEQFGKVNRTYDLYGRVSLDLLQVFKKLEQTMRPSYKLEAVAEEILPELPKLSYEGSLPNLYTNDFPYFLRYNIRDTEILKGFEEKLKYVQFAIDFSHLSSGAITDVLGTIKLTELAIINYCHTVKDRKIKDGLDNVISSGQYTGALVLEPQVGMHEYTSAIDVVSLYPSIIMALNISPETIMGQFVEKNRAFEDIKNKANSKLTFVFEKDGTTKQMYATEWPDFFKSKNWILSGYGTAYTQEFKGIIPSIVEDWFNKRKEYKNEIKIRDKRIKEIMSKYA